MVDVVRVEIDGAVAIVTLNKPPHNLLDRAFLDQYCTALEKATADGARAILVRSELRHFCAGADVPALNPAAIDAPGILQRLDAIPIPSIAAVHGAVLGGGFELALACDLIVAAESAKIGSVEVAIGLAPLLGAVQRLVARAGPARASEIAMLGRRYAPDVLERWGVINLVVPDDELASASLSLARQLAAGPTVAMGSIKRLVRIAASEGIPAADDAMARELEPMWSSRDARSGMEAMAASGPGTAVFEGK